MTRLAFGGCFATMAIRGAVQSAHHLATTDDLLLAFVAVFCGSVAAMCLGMRD